MLKCIAVLLFALQLAAGSALAEPYSDKAGWENALAAFLKARTTYPNVAQWSRWEGLVMVAFVVDRQGNVQAVQVVKSSGFPDLDGEALKVVVDYQPLPPAPAGLEGDRFSFTAPIRYRLTPTN